MKLELKETYDAKNKVGKKFEILDMKNESFFRFGVGVLVKINEKETWLTIGWFIIDGGYS